MQALSAFLPRLVPLVPGCPDLLATRAVLDAAIWFCEESLWLRQVQPATTCTANVSTYTAPTSTDQSVARVLNVWVNGQLIAPIALNDAQYLPVVNKSTPQGYYTSHSDGVWSVVLYPTPDYAYTLQMEVALRPTRTSTTLQNDLFELWLEPIVRKAAAIVCGHADMPCSDPGKATEYEMQARALMNKARTEGTIGRVRASQAVTKRKFA